MTTYLNALDVNDGYEGPDSALSILERIWLHWPRSPTVPEALGKLAEGARDARVRKAAHHPAEAKVCALSQRPTRRGAGPWRS